MGSLQFRFSDFVFPGAAAGSGGIRRPAAKAYGTLAQMMRGIPFPNSNIIFDTQSPDPGAAQKPAEGAGLHRRSSRRVRRVAGSGECGIALQETGNLLPIPGRMCENGQPAPIDQEDFKKWAQGLVDAGAAAYKAAQSKNMDQMVEVSGTVADACAACHEKYRDKEDLKMRCIP